MRTRYSLKSTASFHDVNRSHTNRSKSKQTFSFGKGSRFQTNQSYCQINAYGGNTIKRQNSGISIGKGRRSDFTKSPSISPGVSKYNLKTLFDPKDQPNNGYSLRIGRDKVNFGSYINKQLIAVPAPSRYNNQKKQGTRSPAYSLRGRTRISDKTKTLQPQNLNPGPGQYLNPENSYNSKYASKFSNIGYSSTKSQRFSSNDNRVPGPGNYNQLSSLSKVGKYVVSNHIGGTKAIFDHQKRVTKFDQIKSQAAERPGPGYYRIPSQFGQYDGQVYKNYKTLSTSRYSRRFNSKKD